ncbi:S-layer homology domain-containing protein [Paenibacillus sp. Leaf72]|uniref:S-layer homology domain-containing protein n=1 Tax=Paenibacillus sp. Leaf72 TaxID=1736234 RepID=UPI0006FE2D6C|nr:S-layer homology domain-containing protein [Paenibacillus sp. Leaf72]KQO10988.1 hypothetical protein ASF12_11490 [Paenibacillus sp. Leaf72]
MRKWKQMLSLFLSIALIVTLAPLQPAKAASLYFQFTDFSTIESSPTIVNTNTVNLRGSFADVSPNSITFKVERLVNGSVVASSNGALTPSIIGNTFLFAGVQLYDGLNKITVMGTSTGTSGSVVEGTSYVTYGNVPVITSVQLGNGTALLEGQPVIVTNANTSFTVKASNATDVLINGVAMFNGGAGTFVMSSLTMQAGLNYLTIVSKNGDKSFTLERQVVYFPANTATPFNVVASPSNTLLDGNPVIAQISANTISGKILFKTPTTTIADPTVTLELYNEAGVLENTLTTTVTKESTSTDFTQFSFQSTGTFSTGTNGKYTLYVKSTPYNGLTANFPMPFTVRNASTPYITAIKQYYEITPTSPAIDSAVTAGAQTNFVDNSSVSQLPLWLAIDAGQFDLGAGGTATLTAKVNGAAVNSSTFDYSIYRTADSKQRVFKINALPQGDIELTFKVSNAFGNDTVTRKFTYNPISSIQVTNTFNGAIYYDDAPLLALKGKLLNFKLPADKPTLTYTLNGVTTTFAAGYVTDSTGEFEIPLTANSLVYGSNVIELAGRANGVSVATTFTIYRFSDKRPQVTKIIPVPFTTSPKTNPAGQRYDSDTDKRFVAGTTANAYTTTLRQADLLFNVTNLANLIINVDGQLYTTASVDSATGVMTIDDNKLFFEPTTNITGRFYSLRLFGVELPVTGSKSITVISQVGTESVSQTITITRELPAYEILSPKLPEEAVINQNFINVSILAEGADRVVIGKVDMNKSAVDDIFRYEQKGLKAGTNKIKFTVYRGSEKLNGEFSVNYAADNSIGAQYKTVITKAGKASAFKNELVLNFPKNTFLRPANQTPGSDVKTIDMFDSQQILFGIADRTDGRTLKFYNPVGKYTSSTPIVAQDGTILDIPTNDNAVARLRPNSHFGFASNLFWLDAGYVSGFINTEYTFTQGQHPYLEGQEFYQRTLDKWLETTNYGSITIKYDSQIRNTVANTLSIWRYYDGKWTNIGGKVNTGSKTITAPINGFGYYVVMQMRYSYSDMIGHAYARNSLELMFSRGVMNPKSNNEFGVYDNISRGEFAQLLVKMFQIPLDYNPNDMTFDDVVPILGISELWDYRYIETAVRKGIIRGKGPRQFLPNEALTREEAAVMIARAANLVKDGKEDQVKDRAALQKSFTDASSMDGYALSSILAVVKAKFLEGLPNTTSGTGKATYRFDPKANLNRADASIIAERVMRKNKLL